MTEPTGHTLIHIPSHRYSLHDSHEEMPGPLHVRHRGWQCLHIWNNLNKKGLSEKNVFAVIHVDILYFYINFYVHLTVCWWKVYKTDTFYLFIYLFIYLYEQKWNEYLPSYSVRCDVFVFCSNPRGTWLWMVTCTWQYGDDVLDLTSKSYIPLVPDDFRDLYIWNKHSHN